MIKVGDKYSFKPSAFFASTAQFGDTAPVKTVTGTVVFINEAHRFFRVAYTMPGCIGHECFKFQTEDEPS